MIEKLRQLGLSSYESKCYLALVKYGHLSGKEVAQKSGVPPTSVYRNLETLQKRGFVQVVQKEPLIYQGVDPEIAIEYHIKSRKEELETLRDATINDLESIKKIGVIEKREEVLEVYSGREQSYRLGKKLIRQSKKEFLILGQGTPRSILDLIHHLRSASQRGVACKFIITNYEENQELVEELKKSGIKIRFLPLTGISLLIRDREESQIVIKDDQLKEERIVLNIKNQDFSEAQAHYFDSVWKKATPV